MQVSPKTAKMSNFIILKITILSLLLIQKGGSLSPETAKGRKSQIFCMTLLVYLWYTAVLVYSSFSDLVLLRF